ncbi:hypothetical protein [Citricoccus sp.]|uniref:hypothetical protein n=1 Tax=Citricoccus sp. TaxID=1978372 RepID=UPI0028BD8B4E|nr:hypothetical protein [Citricoccus sp.]
MSTIPPVNSADWNHDHSRRRSHARTSLPTRTAQAPGKRRGHVLAGATLAAALASALLAPVPALAGPVGAVGAAPTSATGGTTGGSGTVRGELPNGGHYVLVTPERWNGTVLIWNPGYGGGGSDPSPGPSEGINDWLVERGYALAGTSSADGGWAVEGLLENQPLVMSAVRDQLGEPEDVIAWGSSMGGLTSVAALEQHADVIDAALPLCGSVAGAVPMLNGSLDGTFALRTLLAPGDERLHLVNVSDEAERQAAFREVLDAAQETPEGRARIALAASLAQIPPWTQAGDEKPSARDWAAQQDQLYQAFMFGVVSPRQPLEDRAGGNFSWNTGVDYTKALQGSDQQQLVRNLYRQAGLSLDQDLETLEGAERISADPEAVAYMQRNATPAGEIGGPVLTLHETGDTAPTVTQARTYADRVRENGDEPLLRQAFVDRPGHCDYADAEMAALVEALQQRLDTGRWGATTKPSHLNRAADRIARRDGLDRGGSFASVRPDPMNRPERGPAPEAVSRQGMLDGDRAYTLHQPADWNGDLVVMPGRDDLTGVTAQWLAEQGYGTIGYELSDGWDLVLDESNAGAAVETFERLAGDADDVVVAGRSQGGLATRIVADAAPEWLAGSLPMCGGGAGAVSTWNYKLDTAFALRVLVDPDSAMQIQGIEDRAAELEAMNELVARADSTDEGRARAVLAAALSKIPAVDPETGQEIRRGQLEARIDRYIEHLPFAMGSHVRAGYEQTVGGTFSWNTGVDYRRELQRSGRWAEVQQAYREAGLSLTEDLRTLDHAERLSADPETVRLVQQTATFTGELEAPVLSLHTTGDGAGTIADDAAYRSTVNAAGSARQLRQTFVAAEGHCTFTPAEEAAALTALFDRIETGRWPSTAPRQLDRLAARVDADSDLELGAARFTSGEAPGQPARMWDVRNWGDYRG